MGTVWQTLATVEGIILFVTYSIIALRVFYRRRKKQKARQAQQNVARLRTEGQNLPAQVTHVIRQKSKRRYIVKAQWNNPQDNHIYAFRKAFPYPATASRSYRPNLRPGSIVLVRAIFYPSLFYDMICSW